MPSRFTLFVPPDYILARDVCSYGYFLLAPNRWTPADKSLTRPLDLEGGVAVLRLSQPGRRGTPLSVLSDRSLSRSEKADAVRLLTRMLRLDDLTLREFHKLDPRWKRSGRGRLFRSPTFFEDVVKTVTSCNVAWPSTMAMNLKLCEAFNPAFPSATQLARKRPATLRARCGVGYRDVRLVELARLAVAGRLDEAWFQDPANDDDTVFRALLDLPGIGPYAAGNIMQLLGRYSRLALDTESVRHGRMVLGMEGNERDIMRRLASHFEPFGAHRFRSYWFELMEFYESRKGPAWTWDARSTGREFTAAVWNKQSA